MAEPKKKLSKTRTNRRRARYRTTLEVFTLCPNCGKPILTHRVCPHCGFYRGVSVIKEAPTKRILAGEDKENKLNARP